MFVRLVSLVLVLAMAASVLPVRASWALFAFKANDSESTRWHHHPDLGITHAHPHTHDQDSKPHHDGSDHVPDDVTNPLGGQRRAELSPAHEAMGNAVVLAVVTLDDQRAMWWAAPLAREVAQEKVRRAEMAGLRTVVLRL